MLALEQDSRVMYIYRMAWTAVAVLPREPSEDVGAACGNT
jgi:hypothetical protein